MLRTVTEMRLPDTRNTLRSTREGTLIVSGTRRFIEQVDEIARAQLVSERTGTPTGFKVFYLRYAWAQDVNINFGGRQVVLPGVATIVRALMTSNREEPGRGQHSYETAATGTQPGIRGQRSTRDPRDLGTLGLPGANANLPSAPVVAAAPLAASARTDGGAAAGQPQQPMVVAADPSQVRVEADARLNAVVVRDAPERLEQYEQLIAALDVEPQSLEIEATIIDLNTERLRELGINWRYARAAARCCSAAATAPTWRCHRQHAARHHAGGPGRFHLGGAGRRQRVHRAHQRAAERRARPRSVSSPQVLTLSNVEAVFDNSSTFFVRVAGRDDVDLFNVSAGTTLRVTPHVFKDNGAGAHQDAGQHRGRHAGCAHRGHAAGGEPLGDQHAGADLRGREPAGRRHRARSNSDDQSKVPCLGDIPLLGALFRNSGTANARVERLFLIQPRLAGRRSQPPGAATTAVPAAASAPVPDTLVRRHPAEGAWASLEWMP